MCANFYIKSRHDFALTDPNSSDVIGFNCEPDEKGNPFWKELDASYLVDFFRTDQPDVTSMNPEEDLPVTLSDFRSGFGMEVYDPTDPKRYYSSIGADMRFRGQGILNYGATAVTMPSTTVTTVPSIANPTMEDNTSWTGGAQASDQKYQGTYSWKRSTNGTMSQNCTTWTNDWRSKAFTFKAWVRSSGVSIARIYIYDGVGTTNSSNNGASGAWSQLTVTRTLDASATQLQVGCENQTGGAEDVWFDLCEITAPACSGATVAGVDFNDELYVPVGNSLTKLNASGDTLTSVKVMPALITDLAVMQISGTDYLFIALGTSAPYWYMNTSETFTQSTATVSMYQYFALVNSASPTLWGNDGDNTLRKTTNPLNGGTAWSGQTTVDSAFNAIKDLVSAENTLFIPKEDRTFYLDSSENVQTLVEDQSSEYASTSGKNMWYWHGKLYIPCGSQALLECDGDGGNPVWRNPADYCTNLSDFVGRIFAGAGDSQWNYIAIDNSTKVEIMAGRLETIGGTTSWVWHPLQEITMTGVEAMWVSTVYQKRLWIASDTAGEAMQYIPLPTGYGNMESDANRNFATGGYFITPWLHGGFKSDTKALIKVTASLGHAYDADIYWECHYQKLGDTSWTDMGDLKGSATSRSASLFRTTSTTSPMFRFKLVGVTDDTTKTPILLNFEARMILYPTRKDVIYARVRVSKEKLTGGGMSHDKYQKMKDCLEQARNATFPVTMKDIDDTTTYVRFLNLPSSISWREPVSDEKGKDREYIYNLLMLKVNLS